MTTSARLSASVERQQDMLVTLLILIVAAALGLFVHYRTNGYSAP